MDTERQVSCTNLNDPIIQHVRTDFAKLSADSDVEAALDSIRARPPEGRILYLYVVDDQDRLAGVVPTRRLLLSALDTPIKSIMVKGVLTIPSSATVLEACEFFLLHRLLAFPVVDAEDHMLGTVDIELYTDELADLERREASDDLFQLIGVHLSESQQNSPWLAFRNRFPWLSANIAGGILAAVLTKFFEVELQQAVALALFIPVVLALAESVAIQSVSLTLESSHHRRPNWRTLVAKLRMEAQTGIMLGAACALVVSMVAVVWLGQLKVAASLLGGIAGGVTAAALIGVTMPNVLRMLDREPQVASGPVALALTDMVTLLVYFSLARFLLMSS